MEGFDTSTMTYMVPPLPMESSASQRNGAMQTHDLYSNFGMSTYAGSDDFALHGLQPMISPGLKRMQSSYDEVAHSDIVSAYDTQVQHDAQEGEPEATIDRDHKLLSFSLPTYDVVLLDYAFCQTSVSMVAQLHGMFFLAEAPHSATAGANPHQELTCYRRNLFQITGNITVPKSLRHIMNDQGEQIPIVGQELTVSAIESTERSPVKIISVPWKTPPTPAQAVPEDRTEKEPAPIPIDLLGAQDNDSEFIQCPISYKRLQFRSATANNGRRKELQQHFVVRLQVMATLNNGMRQCICEVRSNPIIVRGRSPRNFSARKDTPLNGTASHTRKSAAALPQFQRAQSGESLPRPNTSAPTQTNVNSRPPPSSIHSFFDPNDFSNTQDLYSDIVPNSIQAQPNATTTAAVPTGAAISSMIPQDAFSIARHRAYAASSPDFGLTMAPAPSSTPHAPINLSLVEETDDLLNTTPAIYYPSAGAGNNITSNPRPTPPLTMTRESSSVTTPQPQIRTPAKPPPPAIMAPPSSYRQSSFSLNTVSTPPDGETADLLYEYFPLSVDDWMPPVDAVYRPHVVHHIRVGVADPRDPNSAGAVGRSKRYFSEVLG